jgi:hypothetical protein
MLTYLRRAIASRFDHPVFGLLYTIALIFGVAGLLTQYLISIGATDWEMGAGFMAVFASFFALVATIGYTVLFIGKGLSIARDRLVPTS